ncbi:MAG: sigma-70 family RNA polymerase sigma factor [Acidimicrobiales bacterium]|nr:sigma-70 family RNA polymerase sigma factor [Acidimicrobiales bacterium]
MTSTVRAQTGFEEAFDDLFLRAFRVARRILADPATAEDVAAEAMARAFAHWRKIGDQPWREGWVVRVATNLALDIARRRSRLADVAVQEASVEDDDVAVRVALVEAMARLPRRQREVVALRHLAGMSEAETAAALRVSAGSVKTHLSRGLAALRKGLGPDAPVPVGEVADV